MDRLKYFYSEFNTQGRGGENDVTPFGRWAVGTHNTPRGSSCAFWVI